MDKIWIDALSAIAKKTEKMSPDEIRSAVRKIDNPFFAEVLRSAKDFIFSQDKQLADIDFLTVVDFPATRKYYRAYRHIRITKANAEIFISRQVAEQQEASNESPFLMAA